METHGAGPAGHRYFLGMLPFLVLAIVVAVDLTAGPSEGFLPMLSLGPALASVSRRPVPTALVGVLAFGLGLLLAAYDHLIGTERYTIGLITIFGVTAAGVVASIGRQRKERELADLQAVAEAAQQVLLRPVPSRARPLDIAVRYISASAAAQIGGDLYEVAATPRFVRFILGDVQGKGLSAVRTASVVLGAFREAAYDAADLTDIAARIELSLRHQAAAEEFVTVILAEIASDGDVIEILNCGHPPPLLIRSGTIRPVEDADPGLPLGLSSLATSDRVPVRVQLSPRDQVLCYTDGISEARDKSGDFYPLGKRGPLLDHASLEDGDPEAALDRLGADVVRYVGHKLDDDAAMLLVRYAPAELPEDAAEPGAAGDLLAGDGTIRSG
jgi:serine phosphatase RsbU (regulator of sigma subunit)